METLKLDKSKAKKLFKDVPKWFQETLIDTFGKETFSAKITDRIKTFNDACSELGTTEEEFNKTWAKLGLPKDTLNYEKLKICIAALNEEWIPDWNNTSEYKWWPYFKLSSGSGFGFSVSDYHCDHPGTTVGSCLCFKSEELSNYCAKQFIDIYKEFLT